MLGHSSGTLAALRLRELPAVFSIQTGGNSGESLHLCSPKSERQQGAFYWPRLGSHCTSLLFSGGHVRVSLVRRRNPGRPSSGSGAAVSDFSCSPEAARLPTAALTSVSAALGRSSPLTSGREGNWARPSSRRSLCSEIVSSSSRA